MSNWTTGFCQKNGINTHCLRTSGLGKRPSIILLHGLMLSGACWTSLARELEEDYDVIMPDARGHGYSSAPDLGYCYSNLANDVVNLIDALKLSKPIILGHSMGGMTAAVVANLLPQQLGGLILTEPTFLSPELQYKVQESDIAEQHRRVLARTKDDYLSETRVRHSHRSSETIELFVQARFQTSIHAFEILTPPYPDYKQLISHLDIPSLLIIGDTGSIITNDMAKDLAGLNQYLKISQISESGHAVPFDQPEQFLIAIRDFLGSN